MDIGTDTAKKRKRRCAVIIAVMAAVTVLIAFACLFAGSSNMTVKESLGALFGQGTAAGIRIIRNIRIPRVLAALIAGAGLSLSGLIMQTVLNNPMASPSTLGVSNAAVFGANLSIILFAGGFLSTGNNLQGYMAGANPFSTSLTAFVFSSLSVLLILGLSKLRSFRPGVVVLAGIGVGAVWTALTTLLQFYATDVGLSAAVIWTFGDLGRATYRTDAVMGAVVAAGLVFSLVCGWRLNAMSGGDETAKSLGVNVDRLRFIALLISSIMTAVCVSFLGIIGFVGIICPHIAKKLVGSDHRVSVPVSMLTGSMLLLLADTLSRSLGSGTALPVGAVTSLLGAPFFMFILLGRFGKEEYR
ncbi:MAG: iron ABC transporter permease [Clostridia bacterium]|nr:iron ABC transporter permease [Clostridia bacterium]